KIQTRTLKMNIAFHGARPQAGKDDMQLDRQAGSAFYPARWKPSSKCGQRNGTGWQEFGRLIFKVFSRGPI
ncbi:MAG: hypothetical protein KAG97_01060, partial [Victivallales bacterium]|nr:hypothetical protein [Victivallales bacterium]